MVVDCIRANHIASFERQSPLHKNSYKFKDGFENFAPKLNSASQALQILLKLTYLTLDAKSHK